MAINNKESVVFSPDAFVHVETNQQVRDYCDKCSIMTLQSLHGQGLRTYKLIYCMSADVPCDTVYW